MKREKKNQQEGPSFNEVAAAGAHYKTGEKDTITELYEEDPAIGHGFCYGSLKKYVKRLYKKGNTPEEKEATAKSDLYKIANDALLLLRHDYGIKFNIVKEQ